MQTKIKFQCAFIEHAVRTCLNKQEGEIFSNDLEKIKYMRIGENFSNEFFIELSINPPPTPFVDTDGGDEWACACLFSEKGIAKDEIELFINRQDKPYFQLYQRNYNLEKIEYAWSQEAISKWELFKSSIITEDFYQESDNEENFENWYYTIRCNFPKDIQYFNNVEVLRVYGGQFHSFNQLSNLTHLRTVEFVETEFELLDGIELLSGLQQICCWLD